MISPAIPYNENERIKKLLSLELLDTSEDIDYDHITLLASYISKMPVALITLIDNDRQWFKSKVGITACETTRDSSFCAHAILNPKEILVIPDARKDLRFVDNPLTKLEQPIIFYAGVPLLTKEGLAMGSLCVIDHKPNSLDEDQLMALKNLGKQVERLFELNLLNKVLSTSKQNLTAHNILLQDFAGTVSHDLKMPLANLIITSDILKKKYESILDDDGNNYLNYLKKSSLSMSNYITNILAHYESSSYNTSDKLDFALNDMLEDLVDLLDIKFECEVHLPEKNFQINCNRTALEQIFLNLIGNSLKYNDKEHTVIEIDAKEMKAHYQFSIKDNGRGIEKDKLDTIFSLFTTIGHLDRNGEKGHGIGLSTVQKLVENLGGTIKVASELGSFTEFTFTIQK